MLSPAEREDLRCRLAALSADLRRQLGEFETRLGRVAAVIEHRPAAHAEPAEQHRDQEAVGEQASEQDQAVDTVSDCSGVDFERGLIAEARQSGDVCAALERLTARVGEVRAAWAAQLAANGDQATAESARAGQLARWHTDDQAAVHATDRATEPQVLDRCSDGDAA